MTASAWRPRGLVTAIVVAVLSALPTISGAQLRTTRVVNLDAARLALAAAITEATRNGWSISVAVVDPSGDLIAFAKMDGAPPASIGIAPAKARTAARMKRSTGVLDSTLTAGRLALLGLDGITPVEGGVPVYSGADVVGAIGVSGATSMQDAQVARAAAAVIRP
jgi:glc operon protein GlcG